ncbi:RNA-directed DNA polymerase, eukaryota [Tanacetum coccineum]
MDSMILNGQRNTLAQYMILSGADNRPPMLDKDLYDSWKVEWNYTCKIESTLINDMNIYNMKLEQFQVNTMFLNSLPPEWSKFMTDVKLVKDLHTNNFDQLHAYLQQYEIHANEVRIMREHNQDPLALVANHQMTPPHFNTYQSSYNNPQFQQQFSPPYPQPSQFSPSQSPQYGLTHPTQYYSTTYPSTPLAITYPSTPYPNDYSLIHQEACQQRVVKCFNCQGEGHMERQCPKPKRKREATWFRDKVLLVEAQGNGKVLNKEELEFLADPGIAEAKVVLMANLSSNGSDVLFEVPISDNTHNDMLNQSVQEMPYSEPSQFVEHPENEILTVQDTHSSTQQDAMISSVFEQLSQQVTNCNKVNKDNLVANETLSVELERYKERVKLLEERQNVDLEKESLTKTFNVFKNESKEKEAKNIDKEIALEKKVKELDNIVHKMGQSAQTVHMLTKPQVFYDNNLKEALGFQNPFYLKKAQKIRPMLYDGSVITKETNVISIADSEETLMLEEESR